VLIFVVELFLFVCVHAYVRVYAYMYVHAYMRVHVLVSDVRAFASV
jgi:anthranilate/para-aminobenzoate synthase component I